MLLKLSACVILGLLALTTLGGGNSVQAYKPSGKLGCDYALEWKNTNFPDRSDGSEIIHSVAVMYQDDAIGWLFQTRNSKLIYQDGPSGSHPYRTSPPREIAVAVLTFLLPRYSEKDLQKGDLYPVPDQFRLQSLIGQNIELKGCY